MFDQLIAKQGYSNRSEAIRSLIRGRLSEEQMVNPTSQATAGVFLIYDHPATKLSQKLVDLQHNHLLHVIASTHMHVVIGGGGRPAAKIVSRFKNAAYYALREFGFKGRLWTHGCDKRYCFDEKSLCAKIAYVDRHNLA